MANMRKRKKEEGFTLIELIVVVAILGFLLAIAIPRYMTAREQGAAAATKANLHNLATALELYLTEQSAQLPADNTAFWQAIADYVPTPPKPPKGSSYTYTKTDTGYRIEDPNTYTIGGKTYKYYVKESGIIVEEEQSPQPSPTG